MDDLSLVILVSAVPSVEAAGQVRRPDTDHLPTSLIRRETGRCRAAETRPFSARPEK